MFTRMLGVALLLFSHSSGASEFTLRWQLNHEPVNYFEKASQAFKRNVESRSQGKIEVIIDKELPEDRNIEALQDGTPQMTQAYTHVLEAINPNFGIFELPFLFENHAHVKDFVTSEIGRTNLYEPLKKAGIHGLGHTYSGGFVVVLGEKFKTFKGLSGKRYAADGTSSHYVSFLKSHTVTVQSLDQSFVPDLIKSGQISSGECILYFAKHLYQDTALSNQHVNLTRHRVISRFLLMSQKFLESLPIPLRKIVIEEGEKAAATERKTSIDAERQILEELREKKVATVEFDEKLAKGESDFFQPLYDRFIKINGEQLIRFAKELKQKR